MVSRSIARSTLSSLLRANPSPFVASSQVRLRALGGSGNIRQHAAPLLPNSTFRWFSDKTKTEAEPSAKEDAKEEESTESAETPEKEAEAEKEPEVSKEEFLNAEIKDLKDQLLRSLAEQDNTRRIAQRDVQSARDFAIKSFAKSLLDVSDNLTRALEAVPVEERNDKEQNPTLATLYEGIEMTNKGLLKAFEMNGLIKYGEPGETFDPNKHEALYEYVDPDHSAGTIGQVMKSGFMLNKRVLRPAEVGVVKKEE